MLNDASLKIVHQIARLAAVGGSVFDYFLDSGKTSVNIYGNDELVAILYEQAFWVGIKIEHIYGHEDRTYPVDFGERSRERSINVEQLLSQSKLPMIVADKPKTKLSQTYSCADLLNYSFIKHTLIDNILLYRQQHAPKLELVFLNLPSLWYVRNRTDYETELLRGETYDTPRSQNALKFLGKDEEYIADIMSVTPAFESNGVSFLADHESKYINCAGGYRVTTDLPQIPKNTIYTFGNSVCMGMRTDDANTIQSVAQRTINAHFNSESPYSFLNCGNSGHPNFLKQWRSFEYHRPQDDDIAVFISWMPVKLIREIYSDWLTILSPQTDDRMFDRPHNLGDYVFIESLHPSFIGYNELGKYLGNKLIENHYHRTEQNRTEQNRTEQNRTEQNRTEQNRTEQNRTEQNRGMDFSFIYPP